MPIIQPKITAKDIKLMCDKEIESIDTTLVPGYLFLCQDKNMEFNLLVEAFNGYVVTDIDSFQTKQLPELQKLSEKEIKLLHTIFQLKTFTETEIAKKGFLDIKEELVSLVKKKFIDKTGEKYTESDTYILSQLSKYACFSKVEFLDAGYNSKIEAKANIDNVKEKLSKFTSIKDFRECYILKYDINFREK